MADASPEKINNVVICFIIPPPLDRMHSSWRAIVYTKEAPNKVFHGTRNLPSKIIPDREIMKQELCDPDHIAAHIVQVSEQEQYVYIEGDICEVIGTEIHMADGHNDPYLKGGQKKVVKKPKSKLIIPGQPSGPVNVGGPMSLPQIITTSAQAASLGASGPTNIEDAFIVDITFKGSSLTDAAKVDEVKMIAWNHGLSI